MYGYIYIYFSQRRGALRVGSSLVSLVPRCSEPLVSPHFVAPPTSPLCVPIPVLVLRSSAPLSLCPALCRPPGAPARLPLRLRFCSPLSCVFPLRGFSSFCFSVSRSPD